MQLKKGTFLNPFDNVDEAFQYLIQLEQSALAADKFMRHYHMHSIGFDMNGRPIPSWLQPDTASIAVDCPSDSFIVTMQQSGKFQFKPNITRRKYLYRGQHTDYRDKKSDLPICTPNLFRNPDQDYFLSEMILSQEMFEVIKTHPLFQLLSIAGVYLCGYKFQMYTNYWGITQHYYNKTALLDLTSDIDTAKFFACCDYDTNNDTYKPHLEEGIGVIYFYEIKQPMAFQPYPSRRNYEYHLSTIGKQVFPRSGAQHGFLLDMRKGVDLNNIDLADKVYFRHNSYISNRIFHRDSEQGKKYMPDSPLDVYWNEKMGDPKTAIQISESAVKTNLSFNPQETEGSISKKLQDRGFRIVTHTPGLTPEHLKGLYADLRNDWWHDVFTADIHFHGSDGLRYQKAFRSLPILDLLGIK